MSWLKAIGDSLIAGSEMAARNRARNIEETRAKRQDEEAILRMALMREDQTMQEAAERRAAAAEGRAAALDTENRERRIIDDVGPGGVLPPDIASGITTPGLRARLGPSQDATLEATPFVLDELGGLDANGQPSIEQGVTQPAQQAGVPVIPTKAEQVALTSAADTDALRKIQLQQAREQEKAWRATSHPSFTRLPIERRQALWGQAGFSGNVPQTFDEQQALLKAQHELRMKELGVMYPADRFGADGSKNLSPWLRQFNTNKGQLIGAALREATIASQNGQQIDVQSLVNNAVAMAEAMTEKAMGPNPDAPVGPVQPTAGAGAGSPAARWLGQAFDDTQYDVFVKGLASGDREALRQLQQSGIPEADVRRELCRAGHRNLCFANPR